MKKVYINQTAETVNETIEGAKEYAKAHDSTGTDVKLAVVVTEASPRMNWVHTTYVAKNVGLGDIVEVDGSKAMVHWHE